MNRLILTLRDKETNTQIELVTGTLGHQTHKVY